MRMPLFTASESPTCKNTTRWPSSRAWVSGSRVVPLPGPVVVDLRERFATGEGSDGVHYVEGVIGSAFDDTLLGTRALGEITKRAGEALARILAQR